MMVIDKQTQQSIRILAVFRHALLLLPSNPSAMASLLTAIPPLNKHPRPTSLSPLAASVPTEDDQGCQAEPLLAFNLLNHGHSSLMRPNLISVRIWGLDKRGIFFHGFGVLVHRLMIEIYNDDAVGCVVENRDGRQWMSEQPESPFCENQTQFRTLHVIIYISGRCMLSFFSFQYLIMILLPRLFKANEYERKTDSHNNLRTI